MEKKIVKIANFYNQVTRWGTFSKKGICPTLTASMGCGGGFVPMVIRNVKIHARQSKGVR